MSESTVLVDAQAYYRALYAAAECAQRSILIAGWQFDPHIELVRGEESAECKYPVRLWELLNALCEERPELQVFILAWDYSLVYAFERTWLKLAQARLAAHQRIRFQWRSHSDPRGSHHEKLVVVDSSIAFVGGIDLGEVRWDTRAHDPCHPLRIDSWGSYLKPFHDVQVAVKGEVVGKLEELFWQAWQASGATLPASTSASSSAAGNLDLGRLCGEGALPILASTVAISRTSPPCGNGNDEVCETLLTYEQLIGQACRLIYVETQYCTSSAISRAFLSRLSDEKLPRLQLIFVMPNGADSAKERLVLGTSQDQVLSMIAAAGEKFGHQVRVYYSESVTPEGKPVVTFIHSKLMVVDDEALTVGSANLTNRSMGLDTELNLTWCVEPSENSGRNSIAKLRASLLAEHCGSEAERFLSIEGLVEQLDRLSESADSKLRRRILEEQSEPDPLMTALFDPATVLERQNWDQVWEEVLGLDEESVWKRSWEALKRVLTNERSNQD